MAKAKKTTLTSQLKQAIADSSETLYRVAKDSGVAYPILHRFMAGERDIKLETADKLAAYFQLRLTK